MTILSICTFLVLLHGLSKPDGIIRLPTLVALLYAAWFIPQLYSMSILSVGSVPGMDLLILMATFSLMASWFGWYGGFRQSAKGFSDFEFPKSVFPTVLLTLVSVIINMVLYSYRESLSDVSQWSGPATIVAFFAQIRDVVLALSLLLAFKCPKRITIILLLVNLCVSLPVALTYLRRADIIAIGAMLLCGAWFGKGIRLRFTLLLPALCAIAIVVYVVGPLRGESARIMEETGQRVSLFNPQLWARVDVSSEVEASLELSPDVMNAAYILKYRTDTLSFQYGAVLWNAFVELYIPGQLVGYELKRSLQLSSAINYYDDIRSLYGYARRNGTTATGFGSAYSDFWFLGCLYFFVMSYLMKSLFIRASNANIWAQTSYMVLLGPALIAFTHGHQRFFLSALFLVTTIMCLRYLSRFKYPIFRRTLSRK
nr:hypothetical protein [uncultured Celeribacter sp.]